MKKLSTIIPFLNEEKTLEKIFEKIIATNIEWIEKEIIFINDGSTDTSQQIIQNIISQNPNLWIIFYENEKNFWKWYSVKKWIEYSTWDYIIIQDADMEYSPDDWESIINKSIDENLDFVYGSRTRWYIRNWFKYSYISFLLWWLLVSAVSSLFAWRIITDEPTCYKFFKKKLKQDLLIPSENGFEWEPAITMFLLKKWYSYWEVPIHYFPRKSTEWKKIKWIDGIKALKTIIKRKMK